MKTKELMTGDLVIFNDEVYKIKGIYGTSEMLCLFPYFVKNKRGEYLLPIDKHISLIQPIPLTEEILKANGFEVEEHSEELYRHKIYRHVLCWTKDSKYRVNVIEIGCNHLEGKWFNVHEFQHALRLCGLNDLADDFRL